MLLRIVDAHTLLFCCPTLWRREVPHPVPWPLQITLTSSRFLLSNKYGRTFVFFYTVLLHVFILVILYRSSHPRAATCQPRAAGGVPGIHHARASPTDEDDAAGAGREGKTFADMLAENVGTLMQTTKELTNGRRRLRRIL